jgi:hypothetical protein
MLSTLVFFVLLMLITAYLMNSWFERTPHCAKCAARDREKRDRFSQNLTDAASLGPSELADAW